MQCEIPLIKTTLCPLSGHPPEQTDLQLWQSAAELLGEFFACAQDLLIVYVLGGAPGGGFLGLSS